MSCSRLVGPRWCRRCTGLGGIGGIALAIEYARRHRAHYDVVGWGTRQGTGTDRDQRAEPTAPWTWPVC